MALTFAVGDVHGCIRPLNRLLDRIEHYADGGTVVFLGDYIDRGPDSKAVIERILAGPALPSWKWLALKGNHEQMLVDSGRQKKVYDAWVTYGGAETLVSFGGQIPGYATDFCAGLATMHVDRHRIFVHAGIKEGVPLDLQKEDDLLWIRVPETHSGQYGGRHLVHGHTPSLANPLTIGNRTNVDSGCVFGGKLSCAVFDDDRPGGPIDYIDTKSLVDG